ncbi:MAG: MopE-related protein [Pseudomonadota bacterium]
MRWLLPLSLMVLAACGDGKDDTGEHNVDADADGFSAAEDCDDGDPDINPGATERCDGQDNDCDGATDEEGAEGSTTFYADLDGDGYGDDANTIFICDLPDGYVGAGYDCDDTDADTHPGAPETCDGADDDCDGEIDEDATDALTWYVDGDGDGYGDDGETTEACQQPSGFVVTSDDCDDGDVGVHPGAVERCDGVDEDCDREVDEDAIDALTWYADADTDGYGDPAASTQACAQPTGYGADSTDCDDTNWSVHPGADEYCNETDDDCDGAVDEEGAVDAPTWYPDGDGDGYGDALGAIAACEQPSGTLTDAGDCDDADPDIHPGATEICDGADNDCDGTTDAAGMITLDGATNHTHLTLALQMASSGSTIRACDGTYTESLWISRDLTLISQNGAGSTTLDANSDGPAIFVQSGAFTLSGFTLTHGTGVATSSSDDEQGGAMVVESTDPVLIEDCVFQDNTAYDGGALALAAGAEVIITGSTFADNAADNRGGAIFAENATLALSGVLLEANSAPNYSGGAIYFAGGTLDLDASTVQDNTAMAGAGLIVAMGAVATASADTLVTGNSADELGGGIVLIWATSWSGGAIEANDSGYSGGGIVGIGSATYPLVMSDFTCTANSADTLGGCVHATDEVTITGATITDNAAGWGGGLYLDGATLDIVSSTVTANTASHLGGGAYVETGSSLTSTSTDWGTGSDENDPDDVYLESAATPYTFGAGATFTCTDASGDCS